MKKDIDFSPVTGVKLAIAKTETESGEDWAVYIINLNLIELKNVMITSKGYGELEGEQRKTSTLRHLIEELGAQSIAKIEPIDPAVFELTNEFWVSYYILDQIFDKKFIFTPGSFHPSLQRMIPELGLEGVLHS
ncbi:MAG: hypothetical protein NXH89_00675 [Cyclobacteriaceae bacterium]|uniref:Uncharacterized protein n=1 Tax=Algoriphagus marincola TaxID=264027 RepID=A0ABS7NA48_9BACT|nr:hypothetical protein [Algoriphagus marincola]MBY5952763.1 hypothetical protein [Algoriphagus marincola]MCR9080905.1 hypothetical protein [Cyclobacteriaceae bacterium]